MGGHAYMFLQRHFGALRNYDYAARFKQQADLARRLRKHGKLIDGAEVMEIGTGWIPLIPIGFWMCGAKHVMTFDLNRYLSSGLLSKALVWMSKNEDILTEIYGDIVSPETIHERLNQIRPLVYMPDRFLRDARIEYRAPTDAAKTSLPDESIDIQVSTSVFEHIPEDLLPGILKEARRVLNSDGIAIHLIDPTDHFAHADKSIPLINFLQFDRKTWRKYNNNRFAYHNRLCDNDYKRIFDESPLNIIETDFMQDDASLKILQNDFPLADEFSDKPTEELCKRDLYYIAGH